MNRFLTLICALGLLLAACGQKNIQSEAAVRQGVIDYLSKRSDLNMNVMTVDVTSVSFRQNEADATISIRLKGGGAAQAMQMRYTLERKGDSWVVKHKAGTGGGNPHGQAQPGAMGEGMPSSGTELPPGHPAVGAAGRGAMPPPQTPAEPKK